MSDRVAELRELLPSTIGMTTSAKRWAIEQATRLTYQVYIGRSQRKRNWHPDLSFDWRSADPAAARALLPIYQGFFAVEQFVPDYTAELTRMVRRSYGRSQFQLAWGAEEAKHADLWRNFLMLSGAITLDELDRYEAGLRDAAWEAPFDDPLRMLIYTVFQETATFQIYRSVGRLISGDPPGRAEACDPILAKAVRTITTDEAAHAAFFVELAQLQLYFFPEETVQAVADVMHSFRMPATGLYPDYSAFVRELTQADLFHPRTYARDVINSSLGALGLTELRKVDAGLRRGREVPDPNGEVRRLDWIDTIDFGVVEMAVRKIFGRALRHEESTGLPGVLQEVWHHGGPGSEEVS